MLRKCLSERDSVEPLQHDEDALEQEWSLAVFVADTAEAAAQLLKKFHPFDVNGSKRFERRGANVYVCCRSAYLSSFLVVEFSAAPPAFANVTWKYESATVSVTVTSHVTLFPRCHGMRLA